MSTSKIQELSDQLRKHLTDARAIAAKAEEEKRDFTPGEATELKGLLAKAEEAKSQLQQLKENEALRGALQELGEGIAKPGAKAPTLDPRVKAAGGSQWGEQVLKAVSGPDGYKNILATGSVPVSVPLDPEPVRTSEPVLTLRQLVENVPNSSGRFSFMRQNLRTNNAAAVAAGARKPTSLYQLERIDDRTRTIAHLSEPINKADLDDAPMLRSFLDQEMRLGLELEIEDQIINGNGTGENFTGIANVSGSQAQAWTTDILTTTRKAKTKLELLSFLAGAGYLLHPSDWETIELLADNEASYYLGGPVQTVDINARRLWGLPVVTTTAQTAGVAHLVDWPRAARLHVRQEGRLDWSEHAWREDLFGAGDSGSVFDANQVVFRFEGRFGLEVKRPSAIVEIDLTA